MLELNGLVLAGAELKRMKNEVPAQVDIDLKINNVTKVDSTNLALDFTYSVDYSPQVARLSISGIAYCKDSSPNIDKVVVEYKKKKEIPLQLISTAANMINANLGIQAILITRPFQLMPPFMPPLLVPPEAIGSAGKFKKQSTKNAAVAQGNQKKQVKSKKK